MRLRTLATAVLLVASLAGCGTTRVVVRTTSAPSSPPAPAGSSAAPSIGGQGSITFVPCDANVEARAHTTTCGFAENVFFAYWKSPAAPALRVYSPTTALTYSLRCVRGEGRILCVTRHRGAVRFTPASVERYTSTQARAYAAVADLGPDASASTSSASTPSSDDPGSAPAFCDTHDCIPNYPNGKGTSVQCEDGTYSHSGGIQGACSHHGGVGQ